MNRQQKRLATQNLKQKGYNSKQIEAMLMLRNMGTSKKQLQEGDIVRLNVSRLKARPEWNTSIDHNKQQFHNWVEAHEGIELTVEYDKPARSDTTLVCVKEDETEPKWLFWEGDLDVVRRCANVEGVINA